MILCWVYRDSQDSLREIGISKEVLNWAQTETASIWYICKMGYFFFLLKFFIFLFLELLIYYIGSQKQVQVKKKKIKF